ncbi:MAG: response regulator transcription factor [Chloroflexi bacterium]|nr:response regulator transcription factor [Chloroflexota bacterium]MBI2983025.1 response regulator transcription factor [Chloroflexota bacterium]
MKLLVVDDDRDLVELLDYALRREGYEVARAFDGESALGSFERDRPDLVVLDLNLPKLAGFVVLERMRRADDHVAILILSARQDETDVLRGLQLGADDYISKPFRPKELVARVKAILRRSVQVRGRPAPSIYKTGDVILDEATHEVRAGDVPIHLSPTEFKLLRHFMANPGRVLTQEEILEGVWGYDADVGGDLVKLNVSRLRRKLASDGQPRDVIQTVPGVGYLFKGAEGGVSREDARAARGGAGATSSGSPAAS